MGTRGEEWLKLSDYDFHTAELMLEGGRYCYAVFMCQLSLEKALKGVYQDRLSRVPPRAHNLVYLVREIGLEPPEQVGKLLVRLSEASITTRYPETLERLTSTYTAEVAAEVLERTKEALQWTSAQL
jgi:HEPN domain-containing protein